MSRKWVSTPLLRSQTEFQTSQTEFLTSCWYSKRVDSALFVESILFIFVVLATAYSHQNVMESRTEPIYTNNKTMKLNAKTMRTVGLTPHPFPFRHFPVTCSNLHSPPSLRKYLFSSFTFPILLHTLSNSSRAIFLLFNPCSLDIPNCDRMLDD